MGNNSSSNVVYKKVDNTKEVTNTAKEKQKTLLRQEDDRRLKAEDKFIRKLIGECYEERFKLKSYKFGAELGRQNFARLSVSDIDNSEEGVRIAMLGIAGSGKSSFINTCEMAIGPKDRGGASIQTSGLEGTLRLEDFLYDCDVNFRLIDTRGFMIFNNGELFAMKRILYGVTDSAEQIEFDESGEIVPKPIENCIHACIMVLNCVDPRLLNGTYVQTYAEVRKFLKPIGMTPVTVVTHEDKMPTGETCETITNKASAVTGSPRDHVFFIANYREEHMDVNYETNLKVFKIIKKTLQKAERYVKLMKQNEKNKQEEEEEDCTVVDSSGVGDQTCEDFLREQMRINQWTAEVTGQVLHTLHQNDIYLAKDLRNPDLWSLVEGSLSLGTKSGIRRALGIR